jgi:DnaJ family protein C protein 2
LQEFRPKSLPFITAMASVLQLPVVPTPLPQGWTAPNPSKKYISRKYKNSKITHDHLIDINESAALVQRKLLPAGAAYLAHVRRQVHNLSFEEIDKHAEEERKRLEALNGNGINGEDDLGVGDEEENEELLMQDPKEWKVRHCVIYEGSMSDDQIETRSLRCPRSFTSSIQGHT